MVRSAARLQRQPWDAVAERITRDIVEGVFGAGVMLPKIKELRRRYEVSPRTVCKALAHLEKQGLIERQGRGHAVPSRTSTLQSMVRILFLFYSLQPLLPSREADRTFMRALEQECLKSGVHLDCATISASSQGVVVRAHEDQRPPYSRVPDDCAGIIYLVNWAESVDDRIFSWLAHSDVPLSIVDWLGGWEPPASISQRKHVQWIRSRITRNAGFNVGRYLAGLNHKRVAFFSPYTDPRAEELIAGLAQAADAAGPPHSVISFLQKKRMIGEEFKHLVDVRFDKIKTIVDVIRAGIPPAYYTGAGRLGRSTWDLFEDATLFALLEPSFARALADKEISAWVGSDDAVALMAWSYLLSHKRKIPGNISLVGFDNTFDALENDITSYDFSLPATASTALHFLLRPSWSTRIRGLSRPHIEGTIIERGSTALV
jgi:DNA-binding LacI/PurR family transcriptional regulator